MRLTELTHIGQIKDRYITLRSRGFGREDATQEVLLGFTDLSPEEIITFWIGLADGQYTKKELSLPVALQGLLALNRLICHGPDITPGDIERRRKHYAQAPMPERKIGRPRKEA